MVREEDAPSRGDRGSSGRARAARERGKERETETETETTIHAESAASGAAAGACAQAARDASRRARHRRLSRAQGSTVAGTRARARVSGTGLHTGFVFIILSLRTSRSASDCLSWSMSCLICDSSSGASSCAALVAPWPFASIPCPFIWIAPHRALSFVATVRAHAGVATQLRLPAPTQMLHTHGDVSRECALCVKRACRRG